MVDISIVIVSWNAKDYLQKCIDSIYKENKKCDIEVIVVDNASTDGSQDMVRTRFPQVQLICNNDNLGFAKANNIGIKQSSGKYLSLINSDVEILSDCFSQMLCYMEEHQDIGILGPMILNSDKTLQRSCRGFPNLWNLLCRALALDSVFPKVKLFGGDMMGYWPHDSIHDVEVLSGCFWFINRKALDDVGLLDEVFFIYAEDFDWCKRFADAGWRRIYFPLVQAIHYGGASSDNAPVRFYLEMQRSILCYWKKHHSNFEQLVFLLIMCFHHSIRTVGGIFSYLIAPSKRESARLKIKRHLSSVKWLLSWNRDTIAAKE
ncbi:glycosyltransferase family 2 protein [Desulfocastanea catecholica]